MCGRIRLAADHSEIKIKLRIPASVPPINFPPRWNGAPKQDFPIARFADGSRRLDLMNWSLVPAWAKDATLKYATFNARAEDLTTKPTWRGAWKSGRRCVVPVDGFYEWKKLSGGKKQPYLITRADGELMTLAGLWEARKSEGGETALTFTIITTTANTFLEPLHNRMPVILAPRDLPKWMGEEPATMDELLMLLRPCFDKWLTMVPVDPRMGNVKNWQEEFCRPITLTAAS